MEKIDVLDHGFVRLVDALKELIRPVVPIAVATFEGETP